MLDHAKDWARIESIEEAPVIFPNRLPSFDEAFLTSSTAGIIPVSRIEHRDKHHVFEVGTSTITTVLHGRYQEYQEKYFKDRGA